MSEKNTAISVELNDGRLKLKTCDPIKITCVKVKAEFRLHKGSSLLTYETTDDKGRKRSVNLKCPFAGTVGEVLLTANSTVNDGDTLIEFRRCSHSIVSKNLCAECGVRLRELDLESRGNAASVSMIHHLPELRVNQKLSQSIGKDDELRLLAQKKLVLLVDLDQTLIHTTEDPVFNNIKGVHHFQLPGKSKAWYHTRIRPGTEDFLKKISQLFEMQIVTFATRPYANCIASFIDPGKKHFQDRILSRDECFDLKSKAANLKSLLPCGDRMVCIIDDREDVWESAANLVAVKPYVFFRGAGDINAPARSPVECHALLASEGGTCSRVLSHKNPDAVHADRDVVACLQHLIEQTCDATDGYIDYEDSDDYLVYLEETLRTIHRTYFELYGKKQIKNSKESDAVPIPDLKMVIPHMRQKVMEDVVIVFSGCFPTDQNPETAKIYLAAKSLGAKVLKELSKEVTHLVAARAGTAKVQKAREFSTIKVVSPQWLWSCAERWEKAPEKFYLLKEVPLDAGEVRARGGPTCIQSQYSRDDLLRLFQRTLSVRRPASPTHRGDRRHS